MNSVFLQQSLIDLEQKGLKRALRDVSGAQGREVVLNGERVLNFCSNNYLGLADDPRLIAAASQAMAKEGFGAGASRLVCGNLSSHRLLEQKISTCKKTQACLVFSSGYMANVGVISALCGREDMIFYDRLNHASIIDGIILSRAEFKRYPHKNMKALKELLEKSSQYRRRVIITDSVFSMDGDCAPLTEIVALAQKYDCLVMIDEAHGFGVLGKTGMGLAEELGLSGKINIQMGTFSKAAGGFGAYVCGSRELIEFLINHARSFIYTTAMPPAVAAANLAAVEIIAENRRYRLNLLERAKEFRGQLKSAGFDTLESQTPIIPIVVGDSARAVEFSQRLLAQGIFVQAIRPPTVPHETARLRVTVIATHTDDDVQRCFAVLRTIGKDLRII